MRILIFLITALIPGFVVADDDQSVAVLCKSLADYRPVEGVEYVPGKEDVVPVDIGGPRQVTPDIIEIPITVLLAQRFPTINIPLDIELEPDVGAIEVHSDGEVTYRGLNITSDAQVVCAEGQTADGQAADEPLKSEPKQQQEPKDEKPSESNE